MIDRADPILWVELLEIGHLAFRGRRRPPTWCATMMLRASRDPQGRAISLGLDAEWEFVSGDEKALIRNSGRR